MFRVLGCEGPLNVGISSTQPGGRELHQPRAPHPALSPAELLARSLARLCPLAAALAAAPLAGQCHPGCSDTTPRVWGPAQDEHCAALPSGRIREGSLASSVDRGRALRGSAPGPRCCWCALPRVGRCWELCPGLSRTAAASGRAAWHLGIPSAQGNSSSSQRGRASAKGWHCRSSRQAGLVPVPPSTTEVVGSWLSEGTNWVAESRTGLSGVGTRKKSRRSHFSIDGFLSEGGRRRQGEREQAPGRARGSQGDREERGECN